MKLDYPLDELTRALPWQHAQWGALQRALRSGRLPHALLLSGSLGCGRNDFALAFARLLLCSDGADEGNCGRCKSCELTRRGVHADLRFILPPEPGKAIGIDAVRGMLAFATQTSSLGARKVIVISPLEALTAAAFNAFLKLLEEPADDTFFLLVHARGRRVPATIRSRCQALPLAMPDAAAAAAWLHSQAALSSAGAEEIRQRLLVAGGSPLLALEQAESGDFDALLELSEQLGRVAGPQHTASVAAACGALPPEQLLSLLDQHLRARIARSAQDGARPQLVAQLQAEQRLQDLRRALRSGSNPNPDLLRFAAIDSFASACEGP